MLSLGDVLNQRDPVAPIIIQYGDREPHRHATAIPVPELLLDAGTDAVGSRFLHDEFVAVFPVRRRHRIPADFAGLEFRAREPEHIEEPVVGFLDESARIADVNADHI